MSVLYFVPADCVYNTSRAKSFTFSSRASGVIVLLSFA